MKAKTYRINLVTFFISVAIFLLLFIGCRKKKEFINFPKAITLKGHSVKSISLFSRGNVYITVADTFLVIQKSEAPFFRIYSTNTHKLLAKFGTVGKGPNSFLAPSLKKHVTFTESNNSPVVYVWDFKKQRLFKINILNKIAGGKSKQMKVLNSNHFFPFFYYKSNKFYLASLARGGRFYIHNYNTTQDTVIPYIPKVNFNIPGMKLRKIYRSAVAVNEDRGLIAAAPLYFGEINFFNLKGDLLRSTKWLQRDKYKKELSGPIGSMKNIKYQIVYLDAKGGLIYGLNWNNSVADWDPGDLKNPVEIMVFNWQGKPVKKYDIENHRITNFAVDLKHNRIYAYCPDEMKHTILIYRLK